MKPTIKRIKLEWIEQRNKRTITLNKRRLGLLKKVRELGILCDIKTCLFLFSPDETQPMVGPLSVDEARDLVTEFFNLTTDVKKLDKEMDLDGYLEEMKETVNENSKKAHMKNFENLGTLVDELMMQLQNGRSVSDLNLSEISGLESFVSDKYRVCNKRENLVEDVNVIEGGHGDEDGQASKRVNGHGDEAGQASKRVKISDFRENQIHNLKELSRPIINHQNEMNWDFLNVNQNPRSYVPNQGISNGYGNSNLEMEPVGQQMMSFNGSVRSVSQPLLQNHNINNDPRMAMSQAEEYHFQSMSHEDEERERLRF